MQLQIDGDELLLDLMAQPGAVVPAFQEVLVLFTLVRIPRLAWVLSSVIARIIIPPLPHSARVISCPAGRVLVPHFQEQTLVHGTTSYPELVGMWIHSCDMTGDIQMSVPTHHIPSSCYTL